MPWATVNIGFVRVSGFDGKGGYVTAASALVVGLLVGVGLCADESGARALAGVSLVGGLGIGGVGALNALDVLDARDEIGASIGTGLWLTMACGVAMVIAAAVGLGTQR
jgi:hypothetical protein